MTVVILRSVDKGSSRAQDGPVTSLGPRARGKLDKRERIRQAATELFLERGYDAATTKEIAERAGIATGTLFLYARDKADLLCLVMHDRLAERVDAGVAT